MLYVQHAADRLSWDQYFLRTAETIALRSSCPRQAVGAVLVLGNQIVGHGYNGSPRGLPHCSDVGCRLHDNHCIRVVHAELNALLGSRETAGATLFCTHTPCFLCGMAIIQANIVEVVYRTAWTDSRTYLFDGTQHDLLESAGIRVRHLGEEGPRHGS